MTPFVNHPQIEADSVFVRDLPLCQLRLQNQSLLPWLLLVPRRAEVEIYQLPASDQVQLTQEIALASKVLTELFGPDKINVAALGNVVPQLHVHIVGRFKNDAAWPKPVWGNLPNEPYGVDELDAMVSKLKLDHLWG